jgi:alkylhydroperoxidase family enzyme
MSRTSLIDLENLPEKSQAVVEAVAAMLGRVPNSYRVLLHSPHVAAMLLPLNAVLQREGAGSVLSTRIKEMVVIKTSQINGCAY